jgi:hypothetical protein
MARLPRGELHLVDGAGHLCWFDDPMEVSGRVRRFLSASGTDQPRDSGVEAPVVFFGHFTWLQRLGAALMFTWLIPPISSGVRSPHGHRWPACRGTPARFSCLRETI